MLEMQWSLLKSFLLIEIGLFHHPYLVFIKS